MSYLRKPMLGVGDQVRVAELGEGWLKDLHGHLVGVTGRIRRIEGGPGDQQYLVNWGREIRLNASTVASETWFCRRELILIA